MLKKIVFVLIILCSIKFYQIAFVPDFVIKLSEWIGISIIFAFLIIFIVYSREKLYRHHFILPISLILISVGISMLGAYAFNDQSFAASAYAQRAVYFYFVYFLLHQMKLSGEFIIRTFLSFGLIYAFFYITQYLLYPVAITTSKMFIDRGTLRIFLSGFGYLVISYFIWLYLTFRRFKLKYIIFILLTLGITVMMGTRQVIAAVILLSILFVLQSRVVSSKILLFIFIGLAFIPVYFIFQDIVYAMFEVSLEQSQEVESNIRVRAAEFFLTDFMRNDWAYFTGNGAKGPSLYGLKVDNIARKYGFFQSDIGLIGEYTRYGLLLVVGVLILFIKIFRIKLPERLMFIKYHFLAVLLTLVTGGGPFASNGTSIVIHCTLMYLLDLYLNEDEEFLKFSLV